MNSRVPFSSWQKLCADGKIHEVLHLIKDTKNIKFSVLTDMLYNLLQWCIRNRNLGAGRTIHCHIVCNSLESNSYLGSHLIRMLSACRRLREANNVFFRLSKPNVFAWNEIILAHIKLGRAEEAIMLHSRMQCSNMKPDAHILVTILKACGTTRSLNQGKLIHSYISEFRLDHDLFVWSTIIDMYAKCGSVRDARKLFDRLKRKNVVTWSAMIAGYIENGCGAEAVDLYKQMQSDGFDPDLVALVSILKACAEITAFEEGKLLHAQIIENGVILDFQLGNSLLDMYIRCGSIADACQLFRSLERHDVVTWSEMIEAYVEHRDHSLMLGFFELMLQEGVKPDDAAFICLLSACSELGLVEDGCYHFNTMAERYGLPPRLDHFNCMVDLLGRAGYLFEAEDLLYTMPFEANIVGWRSLLGHCRSFGDMELGDHCYNCVTEMDNKSVSCHSIIMPIQMVGKDRSSAESCKAYKLSGEATIMFEHGGFASQRFT